MRMRKIVVLPQLFDCDGNAARKWQIVYYVRNPKTDVLERFRINKGLGPNVPADVKYQRSAEMMKDLTEKLKNGWTPFAVDSVIYEDELRYRHVAQLFKTRRAGNNTARFLASEYLKSIAYEKSEATISTYRSKLRMFCDWLADNGMEQNDITAISNDTIIDFVNFLIRVRELSGNTVKKFKHTLHGFFEFVCKLKHVRHNPVVGLPSTNRINDEAPKPIHDDDVQVLKRVIAKADPQLWLAIQFQFYCALRPGKELRLMRVFDIDFAGGYVYVSAQRSKARTKRAVKIPDTFLHILKNEYELHKKDKSLYVFGKNGMPGPVVLGKNTLRYRFNRFRDDLGLSYEYKFYSWKHTGALKLLRNGFTVEEISKHLGHNRMSSTEYYIKAKLGWESDRIKEEFPEI